MLSSQIDAMLAMLQPQRHRFLHKRFVNSTLEIRPVRFAWGRFSADGGASAARATTAAITTSGGYHHEPPIDPTEARTVHAMRRTRVRGATQTQRSTRPATYSGLAVRTPLSRVPSEPPSGSCRTGCGSSSRMAACQPLPDPASARPSSCSRDPWSQPYKEGRRWPASPLAWAGAQSITCSCISQAGWLGRDSAHRLAPDPGEGGTSATVEHS